MESFDCFLAQLLVGKGLSPQCSGLLLGRKDLIDAALANTNPWEGAVCRPMKVGKEEIMGCLAAVEAWLKMDPNVLYRRWNARVTRIARLVETVPGVKTKIYIPEDGNRYPTLRITWDEQAWKLGVEDCARKLREGKPRIEVLTASNPSGVLARLQKDFVNPRDQNHLEIVYHESAAGRRPDRRQTTAPSSSGGTEIRLKS